MLIFKAPLECGSWCNLCELKQTDCTSLHGYNVQTIAACNFHHAGCGHRQPSNFVFCKSAHRKGNKNKTKMSLCKMHHVTRSRKQTLCRFGLGTKGPNRTRDTGCEHQTLVSESPPSTLSASLPTVRMASFTL